MPSGWARVAELIGHAVAQGLATAVTTTTRGQTVAVSVSRHRRMTWRRPTSADALAGVDPAFRAPTNSVPEDGCCRPRCGGGRRSSGQWSQVTSRLWVTYTTPWSGTESRFTPETSGKSSTASGTWPSSTRKDPRPGRRTTYEPLVVGARPWFCTRSRIQLAGGSRSVSTR